jgi:hypothetical protein
MVYFGSCDPEHRGAICRRAPTPPATTASFAGVAVWSRIMEALTGAHDAGLQIIDTSIVRVHQHASCIARNNKKSRGGLTSKIHAVVDTNGVWQPATTSLRQITSRSSSLRQSGYGCALMSPRPSPRFLEGTAKSAGRLRSVRALMVRSSLIVAALGTWAGSTLCHRC